MTPTSPGAIIAPETVGGAEWLDWVVFFEKFIVDHGSIMELCPDNVKRFPAHISVIVLDNLNGTGIDYAYNENKKKAENRPTLKGFEEDFVKRDVIDRLMGLLDIQVSALLPNGTG